MKKMISNIKISMLRQWLNEDRIDDPKKMITNADIEYWLGMIGSEECRKRNKKEIKNWENIEKELSNLKRSF